MKKRETIKKSATETHRFKEKKEAPKWLLDNIAEASKNARKIYFLFIGFLIYCGLTVVGTTDRQIILNETVNLPIIKMELPLNGFFLLTPIIIIFVFIYFQLYLTIRKDLIDDLKVHYPQTAKECLYPWMLIALDYPQKSLIGMLQSVIVKFSVWWSTPLCLIIISTWFVKKHDPILAYVICLSPIIGAIAVLLFWCQYDNIFKTRQLARIIRKNLGKISLIIIIILYEMIFVGFIIPNANNGFIDFISSEAGIGGYRVQKKVIYKLKSFFCVDLSYQKLISEEEFGYPGLYGANFDGAHLEGANLDNAILTRANMQDSYLQNAALNYAILEEVDLRGANLHRANLRGTILKEADLSAANLKEAILSLANLEDSYCEVPNFLGADLWKANLQNALLDEANFVDACLMKADFRKAKLRYAYFQKADMREADLRGADMEGANFQEAVLALSNLQKSNLKNANFRDANFFEADLRQTRNLSIDMISEAKTLYMAKLDSKIIKQINSSYPHLLKKPEWLDKWLEEY